MGGTDNRDFPLSTTEQLTEGQGSWELIEALELPRPLTALRAVTITNMVYLTGQITEYQELSIRLTHMK